MQTFNSKLSHFPRTHSFVAHATSAIKGRSIEYWMEALNDVTIIKKCSCGKCYSFTLKMPNHNKLFTGNSACVGNFGETLVVLRDNGEYLEVEIPELSNIPFIDEFNIFESGITPINETKEQSYNAVKRWFVDNSRNEPCSVIVD